jgi:hypothetical protein
MFTIKPYSDSYQSAYCNLYIETSNPSRYVAELGVVPAHGFDKIS